MEARNSCARHGALIHPKRLLLRHWVDCGTLIVSVFYVSVVARSGAVGLKPIPLFMLSSWIKAAAKCGFNVQPLIQQAGIQVDLGIP